MANVCKICRHVQRAEIEKAITDKKTLREIREIFRLSSTSVRTHSMKCIPDLLKSLNEAQQAQTATIVEQAQQVAHAGAKTILARFEAYREIAEEALNAADTEIKLKALDRCYKQADIEAKLTGAYQEKRDNEHDKRREREILVERWLQIYNAMTFEDAVAGLRRIYAATTDAERRIAISDEMDEAIRLTSEPRGWAAAEAAAASKGFLN